MTSTTSPPRTQKAQSFTKLAFLCEPPYSLWFPFHTANADFVPNMEIEQNGYNLSINRYKEIVHEEESYDKPKVILGRLKELEAEIASDLEELEAKLR